MHAQPSTLPSAALPARLLPARVILAALLLGAAGALGLASATRAADPVGSVLDAVETTPEVAADALAPIVSTTEPLLEAASDIVAPGIETIEPAVDLLAPALELVPVADAVAPVVGAVTPIIQATEPIVPIVDPIELVPVPLGPTLPILDGRASDAPSTGPDASSAARIASAVPGATDTLRAVRIDRPPRIPEAFVPHPASATNAGDRRAVLPPVTGTTGVADLAVAGSSIGVAILIALLVVRPSSRRAWLPDALGPPFSRSVTVLVPPG